jgi:hypothetical protein
MVRTAFRPFSQKSMAGLAAADSPLTMLLAAGGRSEPELLGVRPSRLPTLTPLELLTILIF